MTTMIARDPEDRPPTDARALGRLNKDGYDMGQFVQIMIEHLPASVPNA